MTRARLAFLAALVVAATCALQPPPDEVCHMPLRPGDPFTDCPASADGDGE